MTVQLLPPDDQYVLNHCTRHLARADFDQIPTEELSIRAQLLEEGGAALWRDFMDELRETHLGVARRRRTKAGPSVAARLQAAYEAVVAKQGKSPKARPGR